MSVARIPPRSPNCNPHAERFIRSVREECTDRLLLSQRGHAEKILGDERARRYYAAGAARRGVRRRPAEPWSSRPEAARVSPAA
ncbi:hypothetical protein [Kitasatospora sp. NPDC093102]|uniref:hypothetical protein n=1 Tax=Kitasatospora sp. NPDC093102 TaxID=3155069 RepID=UPI0034196DAA